MHREIPAIRTETRGGERYQRIHNPLCRLFGHVLICLRLLFEIELVLWLQNGLQVFMQVRLALIVLLHELCHQLVHLGFIGGSGLIRFLVDLVGEQVTMVLFFFLVIAMVIGSMIIFGNLIFDITEFAV